MNSVSCTTVHGSDLLAHLLPLSSHCSCLASRLCYCFWESFPEQRFLYNKTYVGICCSINPHLCVVATPHGGKSCGNGC